jgi:endonuclease/exonuclease/phosphatase family metal-dependent hydrolase
MLKVLTLNLWHDSGPWPERAVRVRAWLDRLAPDLIAFQEVLDSAQRNLARELLEDRPYALAFGRAAALGRDPSQSVGNSVASRWPIAKQETLSLPDNGDGETRSATLCKIDSPHGPLVFCSTHLNWKLHHGFVRERQVVALSDFVTAHHEKGAFSPIVAGDFNAEPESDEIRYMTGRHSLGGRSVYWNDAWQVAGRGDGTTWSNRNAFARIAWEPERRIDYVFVGYPRAGGRGHVEVCRVVCDDERAGIWPSDHFGVYAELRTEPVGA